MAPRDLLANALAYHSQGQLAAAESLYQQTLALYPNAFRAIEGLGVMRMQQGLVSEAAALFTRGLEVRPNSARTHANLGEALRLLGETEVAMDHLRRAAALDPALAQVPNSLGLIAFEAGRRDEAEAAYRQAIRLDPQLAAAHINLAHLHHAHHRATEAAAELRLALAIEPDNRIALVSLAEVHCNTGDPNLLSEAQALCRRAIEVAPQFAPAFENLGNALRAQNRYSEAIASYQRAAQVDPARGMPYHFMGEHFQKLGDLAQAARCYTLARNLEPGEPRFHADLGRLALARGQYEHAAEYYRQAVECDRCTAEFHLGLGLALLEQTRLEEAEAVFLEALALNPSLAASWCALARLQAERGDFDRSCRSARTALEKSPGFAEAYWRLAFNLKGELPESDAKAMEALLHDNSLPDDARALLQFGLAQRLDAQGHYADAAVHIEKANSLQRSARAARGEAHDPGRFARFVDRTVAVFTAEVIARGDELGDPDPRPIFIVGLPHTGTTLVEKNLASHPGVFGAGESNELQRVFLSLTRLVGQNQSDPFDAVAELAPPSARSAAQDYLEKLERLAPTTAVRLVDKMPDNIRFLGLIAMLLPCARVIVCSRDLRDVALSCWQTGFDQNAWTNDWNDIARRFADYQRLMDHWQQVLPAGAVFVRYEDLVNDLDGHARTFVNFAGLDWNPACLRFHETDRVVRTASHSQVRRSLYTDSVERWRRYEPFLKPMFEAFARHGVRFSPASPNQPAGRVPTATGD